MTDLDYDDLPATPPQSRWKRFLKGFGWVCLGLTGLAVYLLFEDLRVAFHVGIGVMFAGWVLKDLIQGWMREVIRQEQQLDRERISSIKQGVARLNSRMDDIQRRLGR